MSFRLVVRPEAEQDVAEVRGWYDRQREGLGGEFLSIVEEFFDHLREFPRLYAVEYHGVRPARLKRFPYVVVLPDHGRSRGGSGCAARQPPPARLALAGIRTCG